MRIAVASAVACLSVGLSIADEAHAAVKKDTTIPAQGLGSALQQLAKDRDVQLVYRSELVGGKQTNGAVGELTFDEALTQLLAGTGLTYLYIDDAAITIAPADAAGAALRSPSVQQRSQASGANHGSVRQGSASAEAQSGSMWQRFRLAQAEQSETGGSASASGSTQSAPDKSATVIDEIIVTAQKREERLQDVPISITVLSGEDLDQSMAEGITETLNRVPGVQMTVGALASPLMMIRGVSAFGTTGGGPPANAFYLDSVPFAFVRNALVPDGSVYDLQRIEVLRGPQGTLYGATSLNGVVRVLTHDPNLDALEFKTRASVSDTEDGGENYRGDAALNIPLVPGKVAVRAVAGYQDLSGWLDKPHEEDANDAELKNFRLKVGAQLTERLSAVTSGWTSRSDYGAQSIGREDRTYSVAADEPVSSNYDIYSLKLDYNLSAFSITSSTSYLDFTNESFLTLVPFGLDGANFTRYDSKMFSEEVLLSSTSNGAWRWNLGAIYRDAEDRRRRRPDPAPNYSPGAPFLQPALDWIDTAESYAVFGEITRSMLDNRLDLTVGLRYSRDEFKMRENGISSTGNPANALISQDAEFDGVTPRVVLTWHANPNNMYYLSYAEGYRSGVPQPPDALFRNRALQPVDEDRLHNYEIGAKGTLWDGLLAYDAAIYYMDWQDAQRPITVSALTGAPDGPGPFLTTLFNTGGVSGPGVDLGLTLTPLDGLQLGVSVSHTEIEYDTVLLASGIPVYRPDDPLGPPQDTGAAFTNYSFPFGSGGYTGEFGASVNYISHANNRRVVSGVSIEDKSLAESQTIARASLGLHAPRNWSATLFIENLNDEKNTPVMPAGVLDWAQRIRPRTIGLQFDYSF